MMDQMERREQGRENYRIKQYVALRQNCLDVSFLVEDYDAEMAKYLAEVAEKISQALIGALR